MFLFCFSLDLTTLWRFLCELEFDSDCESEDEELELDDDEDDNVCLLRLC